MAGKLYPVRGEPGHFIDDDGLHIFACDLLSEGDLTEVRSIDPTIEYLTVIYMGLVVCAADKYADVRRALFQRGRCDA